MKKFLCLIVSIIWMWIWFVGAQSISLEPQWNWVFWYDCVVPIDVYIDTKWQDVAAVDLVMESSMDYVDFVKSDFVPYFFKPIVKENGLIHVVWFTVEQSETIKWFWKMWTIYLLPQKWDTNWILRLYFLWEWETSDTNLSIEWWIDILKSVWEANVIFSKDLPSCNIKKSVDDLDWNNENLDEQIVWWVDIQITWWFANLTYDEVLENTIKEIDKKYWSTSFLQILRDNIIWIFVIFILLIIILLLLKKRQNKWNKNKMNW